MKTQLLIPDGRTIVCSYQFFLMMRKKLSVDDFKEFMIHQRFENKKINTYIKTYFEK